MASSTCKTSVLKVYQTVIEDVIQGVRELFLEDGVDEEILQELKQTWETKMLTSKALQNHTDFKNTQGIKKPVDVTSEASGFLKLQQPVQVIKQVVSQVPPSNHVQTPLPQVIENKMVPIQITLPAQPGSNVGRVLTIQVPVSALRENQLHKVLMGPVITATMNLPQQLASSVLQQHVNAALISQQQAVTLGPIVNKPVIQTDGALDDESETEEIEIEFIADLCNLQESDYQITVLGPSAVAGPSGIKQVPNIQKTKQHKRIHNTLQVDGPGDTSDEDEDVSEDDDSSDNDKDANEQEIDEGQDEEPLNSEDDITDEEPLDHFDTENVIVCQYDKITRTRNKWKFHLKDGIMNLAGEDYVFQKANGESEW